MKLNLRTVSPNELLDFVQTVHRGRDLSERIFYLLQFFCEFCLTIGQFSGRFFAGMKLLGFECRNEHLRARGAVIVVLVELCILDHPLHVRLDLSLVRKQRLSLFLGFLQGRPYVVWNSIGLCLKFFVFGLKLLNDLGMFLDLLQILLDIIRITMLDLIDELMLHRDRTVVDIGLMSSCS